MSLKIRASSAFENQFLKVDANGVRYRETAFFGRARRFRFDQIDYVLMSRDNVLSLQVGKEVFSIRTKPNKLKHREAIEAMLRGVRQTAGSHVAAS